MSGHDELDRAAIIRQARRARERFDEWVAAEARRVIEAIRRRIAETVANDLRQASALSEALDHQFGHPSRRRRKEP